MYNVTPEIKRCVLSQALYAQLEMHVSKQFATHTYSSSLTIAAT